MIIMIIFLILTVLFAIGTAFYLNNKKKLVITKINIIFNTTGSGVASKVKLDTLNIKYITWRKLKYPPKIFSSRFISNGILNTLIGSTYPPNKLPVLFVAIFIIIPAIIRLAPKTTPPPHIQARLPIDSARFCGLFEFAIIFIAAITTLAKISTPPRGIAILVITLFIFSVAVSTSAVPIDVPPSVAKTIFVFIANKVKIAPISFNLVIICFFLLLKLILLSSPYILYIVRANFKEISFVFKLYF